MILVLHIVVVAVFSMFAFQTYADHVSPVSYSWSTYTGPVSGEVREIKPNGDSYSPDYVAKPDYSFSYGVENPNTGDSHGHSETRDGSKVTGEYTVMEPDGVLRRVQYTADPKNGFQASVRFERPDGGVSSFRDLHYGYGGGGGEYDLPSPPPPPPPSSLLSLPAPVSQDSVEYESDEDEEQQQPYASHSSTPSPQFQLEFDGYHNNNDNDNNDDNDNNNNNNDNENNNDNDNINDNNNNNDSEEEDENDNFSGNLNNNVEVVGENDYEDDRQGPASPFEFPSPDYNTYETDPDAYGRGSHRYYHRGASRYTSPRPSPFSILSSPSPFDFPFGLPSSPSPSYGLSHHTPFVVTPNPNKRSPQLLSTATPPCSNVLQPPITSAADGRRQQHAPQSSPSRLLGETVTYQTVHLNGVDFNEPSSSDGNGDDGNDDDDNDDDDEQTTEPPQSLPDSDTSQTEKHVGSSDANTGTTVRPPRSPVPTFAPTHPSPTPRPSSFLRLSSRRPVPSIVVETLTPSEFVEKLTPSEILGKLTPSPTMTSIEPTIIDIGG